MNTPQSFTPGDRVAYIPFPGSTEREYGIVSISTERFVFVKFNRQVVKFGEKGTTAKACLASDLEKIS